MIPLWGLFLLGHSKRFQVINIHRSSFSEPAQDQSLPIKIILNILDRHRDGIVQSRPGLIKVDQTIFILIYHLELVLELVETLLSVVQQVQETFNEPSPGVCVQAVVLLELSELAIDVFVQLRVFEVLELVFVVSEVLVEGPGA